MTTLALDGRPYRVSLAALPDAPGHARRFLRNQLTLWGLPTDDDTAESAYLLLSEIVTNAIRATGRDSGPAEPLPYETVPTIEVRATASRTGLSVEVWDNSVEMPVPTEAAEDEEGGRGVFLVAVLADDWGCRPEILPPATTPGKAVWFWLDRDLTSAVPASATVRPAVPAQRPELRTLPQGKAVQPGAQADRRARSVQRLGNRPGRAHARVRRAVCRPPRPTDHLNPTHTDLVRSKTVTITTAASPFETDTKGITFLELEITGKCNLHCAHCYAESGPRGEHGTMTVADWKNVIDQAYAHETIASVQFIGGEPTGHPDFAELMAYALETGLGVEVYSNLVSVTPELWQLFSHPNAYLATSYYSDVPETHDAITRRKGSHAATLLNIKEAVRRGIIIRAGVVEQHPGQRAAEAAEQLRALGVHVNLDRMRAIGRGDQTRSGIPSVTELCGRCAKNNLAISPNGDVWGCTISRFLPSPGNVKVTPLAEILASAAFDRLRAIIPPRTRGCDPDQDSAPSVCGPQVNRAPAAVMEKAAQ